MIGLTFFLAVTLKAINLEDGIYILIQMIQGFNAHSDHQKIQQKTPFNLSEDWGYKNF